MAFAAGRVARRSRITADTRPPTASPARTALPAAYFDRNESHVFSGIGHYAALAPWVWAVGTSSPRYAAITFGSRRIAAGGPSAIRIP